MIDLIMRLLCDDKNIKIIILKMLNQAEQNDFNDDCASSKNGSDSHISKEIINDNNSESPVISFHSENKNKYYDKCIYHTYVTCNNDKHQRYEEIKNVAKNLFHNGLINECVIFSDNMSYTDLYHNKNNDKPSKITKYDITLLHKLVYLKFHREFISKVLIIIDDDNFDICDFKNKHKLLYDMITDRTLYMRFALIFGVSFKKPQHALEFTKIFNYQINNYNTIINLHRDSYLINLEVLDDVTIPLLNYDDDEIITVTSNPYTQSEKSLSIKQDKYCLAYLSDNVLSIINDEEKSKYLIRGFINKYIEYGYTNIIILTSEKIENNERYNGITTYKYNTDIIKKIYDEYKYIKIDNKLAVIVDLYDIVNLSSILSNPSDAKYLYKLFTLKSSNKFLLNCSFPFQIPPEIRGNINCVIYYIGKSQSCSILKRIYEYYYGFIPSFSLFDGMIKSMTNNIIITFNTNNIMEKIFWNNINTLNINNISSIKPNLSLLVEEQEKKEINKNNEIIKLIVEFNNRLISLLEK
jgi:hypothetical protein